MSDGVYFEPAGRGRFIMRDMSPIKTGSPQRKSSRKAKNKAARRARRRQRHSK